jgi:hypothetical protein
MLPAEFSRNGITVSRENFIFQEQPAQPPVFTKKIQPCRVFEQEQAKFEVEFDGTPLPQVKWYRQDFLIQNSPDFQIHTFSTKSILIIRQVRTARNNCVQN